MIEIKNLVKSFGRTAVLKELSLSLQAGECIALTGPNGCGKTTLVKAILGMVLPDKGEVYFDNKPITADTAYRGRIGYMPQIGRYPENMTIGQVMDMIRHIRGNIKDTDTELYREFRIGEMLDKKMRTLSGGTTQKVSATLAFLFDPPVLILDEPTAGLDPLAAEILKAKIIRSRQERKLILITSHLLSEMEGMISQVILMQEGKLVLHSNISRLLTDTGQLNTAAAILHVLKEEQV